MDNQTKPIAEVIDETTADFDSMRVRFIKLALDAPNVPAGTPLYTAPLSAGTPALAPPTDKEISAYRDLFRRELDKRMDLNYRSSSPSTESHEIALRRFVESRNAAVSAIAPHNFDPKRDLRAACSSDERNQPVFVGNASEPWREPGVPETNAVPPPSIHTSLGGCCPKCLKFDQDCRCYAPPEALHPGSVLTAIGAERHAHPEDTHHIAGGGKKVSRSFNRIWLQPGEGDERTWCQDRINDEDVEYVRADLVCSASTMPLPGPENRSEDMTEARLQWVRDLAAAGMKFPGDAGLDGYAAGWHDGFAAGAAPSSVARSDGWIPVEVRRPDGIEEVLVATAGGKIVSSRSAKWVRVLWDEVARGDDTLCAITHWMPMPDAPFSAIRARDG